MGRSDVEFEVEGEAGMTELEVNRAKKASMSVSSGWGCRLGSGRESEGRDLEDASGTLLERKVAIPRSIYLLPTVMEKPRLASQDAM